MEATDTQHRTKLLSSPLSCMAREYWRASRILYGREGYVPCYRSTAIRCLMSLARQTRYSRLRCAAGGTLVSLGLSGIEELGVSAAGRPPIGSDSIPG